MYDVVVIGGGAMGSAAALRLADEGREVLLLEQYRFGHDRGGSHGGTRLFRGAVDDADYLDRVEQARVLWNELEDRAGVALLEVTGGLDHGTGDAIVSTFRDLFGSRRLAHEVLDPDEAAERWPGMRFRSPVLYQEGSGRLLCDRAVATVQALARSAGADLREGTRAEAVRVERVGDGVADGRVTVEAGGETLRARQVVVTAGPWAPALLDGLLDGIATLPPLRVTQEQPRFFAPRAASAAWPSFVHWRTDGAESYGLYEAGSGVKVGLHATGPEIDPDVRRPSDPDVDAALLRYVEEWLPGLDPTRSTPISCLYDNTPRETFVIDRVGPVTVATGFCGQGFKFVPLVARYVADLVTGAGGPPADYRLAAHVTFRAG